MKDMILKIITKIKNFDIKTQITKVSKNIFRKKRRRKWTDTSERAEFVVHRNPKSPPAEAYRMLRTNIQYSSIDKKLKCIVVTSSGPREGKTTTVINVGCAFAQTNKKTLIIDSDLRNSSFHRLFKLNNDTGFTSVICGQKTIEEAVHKNVLIPNLDILTGGPKVTNPAELMASRNVADFMNKVRSRYDAVIFDSPPTLAVTDAKLLSIVADGVILIIQCNKTVRDVAKMAKKSLKDVHANIIGVILNDLDISKHGYYYYHRYYYSYYAKEKGVKEKLLVEKKVERKEEIEQKPDIIKKKSLFIPDSSGKDKDAKPPSSKSDSIIAELSEKEKKEAEQKDAIDKKSSGKKSALGGKTIFLKDLERPTKEKTPDKRDKYKTGLGKKDIFKDI